MKNNICIQNMYVRAKLRGGETDDADTGEAVGTGNDARVALLNSIGDNADRERGVDFADVNDDGSTSEFAAPVAEDDAEARAAAEAEATEAARLAAEQSAAPEQAKIVRKVNGQDMEITDDLLVKAQKVAAADAFLADAKRMRDELAAQVAASKVVQQEPVEDDLAQVARALQMGTEEEAVAALRKLMPKGPSTDDLAGKIDERLTFNTAYSNFCKDYSDIVGDPRLKQMAEDADMKLLQQGDTRSYSERFTEIGNDLRQWVGSKAPAVAAPEVNGKEQRKAAAPAAVKATNGKHAQVVEEEKEESVSDTIAAMAQQRGGPQWMNGAGR